MNTKMHPDPGPVPGSDRRIASGRVTEGSRVHTLALGPMENLVYVIEDAASRRAAVIDPAWEPDAVVGLIEARGLDLVAILLTHGHDDHVNGVGDLLSRYWASVHITAAEDRFWRQAVAGEIDVRPPGGRRSEVWYTAPPPRLTPHAGGDRIGLGGLDIEVLETPGHSPGGACYLMGDHLFAGDTLFVYGCGRCDLAGSDAHRMFRSLAMLEERIPDRVMVHPGHDYGPAKTTSMAEQRRGNPFLHIDDEDAFVAFRAEHNNHRLPPYGPVTRGERIW